MALILLRHGRTPNNAEARLQGQEDSPLDEVGEGQARSAGDYIRSRWSIDRVVVSPLSRTRQTADLAGLGHLPTTVDERWREIDFGEYDLRRIREVIGELGARWATDIRYEPPGGESMADMHERVVTSLSELAGPAHEENIVVVGHATPIKSAVVWALGGPPEMILNLQINLATVSVISPGGPAGLLLSEFNRQAR